MRKFSELPTRGDGSCSWYLSLYWPCLAVRFVSAYQGHFFCIHADEKPGNNIVSYYLGDMLDQAGSTDTTTQLEIVSSFPKPVPEIPI